MHRLAVTAVVERFAVAGSFVIARGATQHVDVVVATVGDGAHVGRGEATPVYYEGETAEGCIAAILDRAASAAPLTRASLLETMKPGAARNALDCALWDLEAQRAGRSVAALAGLPEQQAIETAYTISVGAPEAMEAAARAAASRPLLKVKLDGRDDRAKIAAVRRGAPAARLIADANESWGGLDIAAEAAALAALGVEMIEQPVRAGAEERLAGVASPVPLVADESCQSSADLDRCIGRFQGINIKLDKAGGLTEALRLADAAAAAGLDVMIGCMLCTSLAVAPAALLASRARWVDLDGPLLLAADRAGGFVFEGGRLASPPVPIWGGQRQ